MTVCELGIKYDLTGQKFGRLTVIKPHSRRGRSWLWLCKCDCGKETLNLGAKLKNGLNKSCGCYKAENVRPKYGKNHRSWCGFGELSGTKWCMMKLSAKDRNIPFQLTIKEAWEKFEKQEGKCALTGLPIHFAEDGKALRKCDVTASLDRINSDLGYTKENIQWVHKDINYMKQWFTEKYFFELCKRVIEYNKL